MAYTGPDRIGAERSPWAGWVAFAGLILILVGLFNSLDGLTAIFNSEFLLDTGEETLVFDLTAWGWIHLIIGLAQIGTGIALFGRATWPRVAGVILLMVNAVGQMAFLPVFPIWSSLIIILDIVCVWALVVHGEEVRSA